MGKYLSIGDTAAIIGVSPKTLRRWHKKGTLIPRFRTAGGHRRYKRGDIFAFLRKDGRIQTDVSAVRAAVYARVSSSKQKTTGDLGRQIDTLREFCAERNYHVVKIYSDVGSGLNDKRRGMLKMLEDAAMGEFDVLAVHYNDRLARFGIKVIKKFLESWDVDIEVKHPTIIDDANPNADLVTDLTAILYSFMGKLYRKRRGKGKKKKNRKNTIKPLKSNAVSC